MSSSILRSIKRSIINNQYSCCDQNDNVTKAIEEYFMMLLINSDFKNVSRKEQISDKAC